MLINKYAYDAYMSTYIANSTMTSHDNIISKKVDIVEISSVASAHLDKALNIKKETDMHVEIFLKSGRKWVGAGMRQTMGEMVTSTDDMKSITTKTFKGLLVGRHSPIEEYEVWVVCVVPERVHTHVVRHRELSKYVTTSRPDISYHKPIKDGERIMAMKFNAKRLIEICWQRRCFASWIDTRKLLDAIAEQVESLDPAFKGLLVPSCVWFGWCPEVNNKCKYYKTKKCKSERTNLLNIVESLYNK